MDAKIKTCPNCSQVYYLKSTTQLKGNIPLFLECGHTMCETCVSNILKFEEPIECKVCLREMVVSPENVALLKQKKIKLYNLFPVNLGLLGELTLQLIEDTHAPKKEDDYFVNLQAIIRETDLTQEQCVECHNRTSKMCVQCATVLCDICFNKSHKNFVIFKNHVLQNIEHVNIPTNCKVHKGKSLDYYCKDCSKSICMDCLMVGGDKSCKNHDVVSMQEVNDSFQEEINEICPKVDETFRRLTKTAVDVGHLLHNIENETGSSSELTQMLATVEQHFSKLSAAIQKHKNEVVDIIVKLKCSEKESLRKAKSDLEKTIRKAKTIINAINCCSDSKKTKQVNLSVLLDDAKQIIETPWYLSRDQTNDPLKIVVNEDVCSLVSDYIHLEGNANSVYKLKTAAELGSDVEIPPPPVAPVYPPELPKDVRQKIKSGHQKQTSSSGFCKNVPHYRAKSASVSSLNSTDSNSSMRSRGIMYGDGYQNQRIQPVPPFAESQHPRQLHEGSQELIYITHIVDPHNFFVQRACHQAEVKEMLREFRNAHSLPKPSLNHVAEGKLYLMLSKADNTWQRCRVISINRKCESNPTFLVFCIDFGSTEAVTIDNLRLLPPARVQKPYPLAIHCSLANCVPKAGAWSSDDAYLIQNIIDNKQAILHVRNIRSTSNYTVTLECDVITFEDGVSLVHALVFHDRAKLVNPKLPFPNIKAAMDKPRLYTNNADFKYKSVEEVYITQIVSPDKFFVRKRHLQDVYEKLTEDLCLEYSMSTTGNVYLPEIGMVYAVNVEKYRVCTGEAGAAGGWARGVVHELPGRGRARVLLPDCGALLLVHWTALRHLHPKFTTLCALATECHLAGVTPLNKKWSTASVALLQRFEGRLLELLVEDNRRGSIGVSLYDKADEENVICINTEMLKHKFAVAFGLFIFNKNTEVENQIFTSKSLDPPKQQPKKEGQISVLQKKKETSKKIDEKELEAKDKGPIRLEAKVLLYQSPSLIYVSLTGQQKTFNELYEKIQSHYSTKRTQGKKDWAVGDRCCTLCSQSSTWRRAVILEIHDDSVKVFYTDFACAETVPVANLKELASEFALIGDAAIKCHLCGIMPADGSEEWPTITKEYLKELLDVYQRIFITKSGDVKNRSMPIEIWVYHTIQGEALEPNKSEWRCLNRKIIEQGLAVPDKTPQGVSNAEAPKDDMLSFLDKVTGSINEYLLLEPLPTKPLTIEQPTKSHSNSPADEDEEIEQSCIEVSEGSNTIYVTDWLPPEPLKCSEFTGVPTYVDNEGIVYLHDVSQQNTLDLIRQALDVRFKSPDPKAKYMKWTVGEPCVALYYLDNRFYRGRVIDVNQESKTCLIHYIDYGNEEWCSYTNLRKTIVLHQIPTQAYRCLLARIRPVSGQWDRITLDYIHKSIVEKHCFVKIAGEPIGGVIPIDLKYDKLWINDHLVDFEMAVYTDGSKAVVRKFAATKSSPRKREIEPPPEPDFEPDYIIEEDESNSTFKSLEGKDWNQIIEEQENGSSEGDFVTISKFDKEEFLCNITIINDTKTLELSVIHNDEDNVLYEAMFDEIRREGADMPPLNGIYEHKACIALFHEDGQWYRAIILEYSESETKMKVRYVDYGNKEIISLADAREISSAWTALPPGSVQVKLSGVRVNPEIEISVLSKEYANTFLDKGPFHAKVIDYNKDLPVVELRDDDGALVYQSLIDRKVFLQCDNA